MANSFEFIFVLCQMTTIEIEQFTNERFLSTQKCSHRTKRYNKKTYLSFHMARHLFQDFDARIVA